MTKFYLTKIDQSKLSREIIDFGPIACMECDFDGSIPIEYFLVKPDLSNEKDYKELQVLISKELGYTSFSEADSDLGHLVSVCRCPNCGSEEIFQDF